MLTVEHREIANRYIRWHHLRRMHSMAMVSQGTCLRSKQTVPSLSRTIHHLLSRGERRNALARDVFHGRRGQLRRHYQVGQENQLGSLGIMVNIIVLCYPERSLAALDHLATNGYQPDPADVARLTPLGHPTINLEGRYRTTSGAPTGLRPLRTD